MTLAASASTLQAHHSGVMFDDKKEITLDGVVKEFQFTNPHSWLLVDVTDKDGKVTTWGFEAEGPSTLIRNGVRLDEESYTRHIDPNYDPTGDEFRWQLLLLGEPITAREGERIGLVNRAVPAADFAKALDEVVEKFGVPPEKVVDVQSLAGDSVDNVPGIPGIGIKTAAHLWTGTASV